MNKTECVITNTLFELVWKMATYYYNGTEYDYAHSSKFSFRNKNYELSISEEDTILYLKDVTDDNNPKYICTLGITIDAFDTYDELIKMLSRQLLIYERHK